MSLVKKLVQNPKKKIIKSKFKVGDLIYYFGSWEGEILEVQRGIMELTRFGYKRVENDKFFYKIKYLKDWMGKIKMVIGIHGGSYLTKRESIWKDGSKWK